MDAVAKGMAVRCEADTHRGAVNTGTGGTSSFLVIWLLFPWLGCDVSGPDGCTAEILSGSAILQSA